MKDQPLERYRQELLDLAFRAASKFPLFPHEKNRSRAQQSVVNACLELDQPQRALRFIERIRNWRRGESYADLAYYCARRGDTSRVRHYLALAAQVAESSEQDEDAQEWRHGRIRAKIARTHLLLGDAERAAELEEDVVESELGTVQALRATLVEDEDVDERLEALDGMFATDGFEQVKVALETGVQLFDRFYARDDRREEVVAKMKTAWGRVPVQVFAEAMMDLAEIALENGDRERSLELVNEAQSIVEGTKWLPQDRIPLIARLAALRYRACDDVRAREQADAALAAFDEARSEIVDVFRAGALRPLAEAYHAMGDREVALSIYSRAIEEGVANPNSRPRANDLCATCISMALSGVEPDDALLARMYQVFDGLGDPW